MNNEKVFDEVLKKIKNEEIASKEELVEHMTELKNRGILTKGQMDAKLEELAAEIKVGGASKKTGTRAPKTMEYAYSNVSAGFSQTGMLMLIAISVPVLIGMITLLNK